jgi:transposase
MKKRAHYSANFKAQIVREILKEEKTIPQIAAEHGIHPNLLRRWHEIALAGLPSQFSEEASTGASRARGPAATERARVVCGNWPADDPVSLDQKN